MDVPGRGVTLLHRFAVRVFPTGVSIGGGHGHEGPHVSLPGVPSNYTA